MIELIKGKHIVLDIHVKEVEDETEEWEAEEYHEDEYPTDSSSPSEPDLEKIEKESIIRALQRNWSRKKAAEDLHISVHTLLRKIKKYGITNEVIIK